MAVNLLLSYAFHADTKLDAVRRDLVCGRLMIDSGAFTAWSKGRTISLYEYAEYLKRWAGCWDHAITLDVIGDPVASRANTRRLHDMGLPVMPVFTRSDTLAEFDAMVADVGYVAVGGLVGLPTASQRARAGMLQRRAQDAGGGIHALGIGSLTSLRAARPYSADASSVSGAFRFGTIVYFDGREIRNTPVTNRARLRRDWSHIQAHGIDLALIASTGRMPSRENQGRQKLMQAMSLAYAAADEYLKSTGPVSPPRTVTGEGSQLYSSVIANGRTNGDVYCVAGVDRELHQGPNLYSSISSHGGEWQVAASVDQVLHRGTHLYGSMAHGEWLAMGMPTVDRELHSGGAVPKIWRTHGRNHQCRAKDTVNADTH
jgi:hypothetical protein